MPFAGVAGPQELSDRFGWFDEPVGVAIVEHLERLMGSGAVARENAPGGRVGKKRPCCSAGGSLERACGAENLRLEKECFGVLEYFLRAARKLVEKLTVELCRRLFGRHRLRLTMSHARGALLARWMPYRRASPGKPASRQAGW